MFFKSSHKVLICSECWEPLAWVSCPSPTPLHPAAYPPSLHKTLPQLWSLFKTVRTITKRQSPGFSIRSRFSLLPCPCGHSLCFAASIPARATPVTLLFEKESRAQKMNYEQNWDTVHGVRIIQTLVNGIRVWNKSCGTETPLGLWCSAEVTVGGWEVPKVQQRLVFQNLFLTYFVN